MKIRVKWCILEALNYLKRETEHGEASSLIRGGRGAPPLGSAPVEVFGEDLP